MPKSISVVQNSFNVPRVFYEHVKISYPHIRIHPIHPPKIPAVLYLLDDETLNLFSCKELSVPSYVFTGSDYGTKFSLDAKFH